MRRVSLIAALAVMGTAAQAADGEAVTAFGLAGRWAVDCAKPPSGDNPYMNYVISAVGTVTEELGRGAAVPDRVSALTNVQSISPEWLLYSLRGADGGVVNILTFREGYRKKSWWSVGQDGTAFIVDGKFVSSAGESPWLQKCETAP